MESYPSQFLAHLAPLVVVQGLDACSSKVLVTEPEDLSANPLVNKSETLFRKQPVISEIPFVEDLIKIWRKYHVDGVFWDSSSTKSQMMTHPHRYRFKLVDSSYLLPKKQPGEHSPLSIDTDKSPVYPNGILTLDWLQKLRSIRPCVFIAFYEMDAEITEAQDISRIDTELASEINILKEQISGNSVNLLVIIVSSRSTALNPGMDERVNTIRRMTNLNSRNGLLFLPSATPKEITSFALDTLQIIKSLSNEFYGNMDKNIKKRRAKVLGASPATDSSTKNRVETRYALKLAFISETRRQYDLAIKSFEAAYENLVEIFNTLPIKDPNWSQLRLLLDITIFHLVRAYFYLEQPNVAYKKFDVHLQTVTYFLSLHQITTETKNMRSWLSQQFKWLAQLSDLTPVSLIPADVPLLLAPGKKDTPLALPQAGYLYLQAADILRRCETTQQTSQDQYNESFLYSDFTESLINLLTFAKLAFQKKDNTFNRSVSFINFQLAEENFELQQFERALKLYEQASDSLKEDDWSRLLSVIHCRLFECCIELGKLYPSVVNFLEIALVPQSQLDPAVERVKSITKLNGRYQEFMKNGEEVVINAAADSNFDLFESELLFKESRVPLTKDCHLQLKLTSKLNNLMEVSVLNNVVVTFDGCMSPIIVKHDAELESKTIETFSSLLFDEATGNYLVSTNMEFKSYEEKIFKFVILSKKIGQSTCSSVNGVMTYHDYFKVNISIPIATKQLQYRHIWYHDSGAQDIVARTDPSSCEVIPRAPETKVTLDDVPKFIFSGERVHLPIKVYNTDHENIDLKVKPILMCGDNNIVCRWGNDQVDLEIKSVEVGNIIIRVLSFVAPVKAADEDKSIVNLSLQTTFIVNGDEDVPIYDIKEFDIALVDPVKVSLTILPRLRGSDLPDVFVIKEGDAAVPKPSRFWLMRATVTVADPDLIFVDDELSLSVEDATRTSVREHIDMKTSKPLESNKTESDHYVETAIEDGRVYRSIAFEAAIELKWKRKGSQVLNEYKHEHWSLSLPLLDPRVLLHVEPSEENNDLKLVYLLENPTSRVFSFSTTLIENQSFQVTGTKSLSQLSVLPCTRQEIVFHATPLSSGWVQLPQLKVYDLNYRVNLPTLPISDMAQTHKHEVYVRVEES